MYIETDYFGGYGTQIGILFKNNSVINSPISEEGIINKLLKEIGVLKYMGKDEFDSLGLGCFCRMEI